MLHHFGGVCSMVWWIGLFGCCSDVEDSWDVVCAERLIGGALLDL